MSRWTCLHSSCAGYVQIVTTSHAKTEGRWYAEAECQQCGALHRATKGGLGLVRSTSYHV